MKVSAQRIADRHIIQMAVRKATSSRDFRRRRGSVRDLTPEVLETFAVEFYLPMHQGKVAFGSLTRKLREMSKAFSRYPKLWQKFKDAIGVQGMMDLPGAIRQLAKDGHKALKRTIGKAFDVWPLKLYTLPASKVLSVNTMIEKLMDQFPQFKSYLSQNVKPKVDLFDRWLRKHLPTVSRVLMVAIFIFIWLNVVEFEWDIEALVRVMGGQLSLAELLASLPGSALGAMMNGLGLGTFTLLPVTIVARLMWLTSKRYLIWTGRGFELNWDHLAADGLVQNPAAT
ncbi:hypothetical protein N9917_01075 [Deltaproteobacteria bacterium]|nr:hypothetical protein [Deltaproteobacteria bacterium]